MVRHLSSSTWIVSIVLSITQIAERSHATAVPIVAVPPAPAPVAPATPGVSPLEAQRQFLITELEAALAEVRLWKDRVGQGLDTTGDLLNEYRDCDDPAAEAEKEKLQAIFGALSLIRGGLTMFLINAGDYRNLTPPELQQLLQGARNARNVAVAALAGLSNGPAGPLGIELERISRELDRTCNTL